MAIQSREQLLERYEIEVAYIARSEQAIAADLNKNERGHTASMVGTLLIDVGVLGYHLHHDIQVFRQSLARSAALRAELIGRSTLGTIPQPFVDTTSHKDCFAGLAAGNFTSSRRIAEHLYLITRKRKDHPVPFNVSALLSEILVDQFDPVLAEQHIDILEHKKACKAVVFAMRAIAAVASNRKEEFASAMSGLVQHNGTFTKRGGIFAGLYYYDLVCLWGIAIANLAVRRGMDVFCAPPLIPAELVCQ